MLKWSLVEVRHLSLHWCILNPLPSPESNSNSSIFPSTPQTSWLAQVTAPRGYGTHPAWLAMKALLYQKSSTFKKHVGIHWAREREMLEDWDRSLHSCCIGCGTAHPDSSTCNGSIAQQGPAPAGTFPNCETMLCTESLHTCFQGRVTGWGSWRKSDTWILTFSMDYGATLYCSTSVLVRLGALAQYPGVCNYLLEFPHLLTKLKQWTQPLRPGSWELKFPPREGK